MMPLTSVFAEIETSVVCERPNVATSAGPLGTAIGVQLPAVFQSPETGSRSHWVLTAYVTLGTRNIREQRIAVRISVFIVISGVWHRCERLLSCQPGSPFGEPNSP
jgi:hypothetical protein